MRTKVGFFANQTTPTLGGMFTFERTIISIVERLTPDFDPVVISRIPLDTPLHNVIFPLPTKRNPLPSLDEFVRKEGFDLIWFSGAQEPVSVPFVMTVLDLAHRRFPFFPEVSSEGWLFDQREEYYNRTLPVAFKVIAGTDSGSAEVSSWYRVPPERVKVIPFSTSLWVHDVAPQAALSPGLHTPYFLYPAQFWAHKNHTVLLEALAHLKESHSIRHNLVFTGADQGNSEHIKAQAQALGVADQVTMLGFVGTDTLAALYRSATALVFPSFFGPDNLPPLEAAHFSCPVIAASIVGASDFLGAAALLADPLKPVEWATAMCRLTDDAVLRNNLVAEGLKLASKRTPGAYGQCIEEVVAEFSAMRRRWKR